jgi:hypothetical protein
VTAEVIADPEAGKFQDQAAEGAFDPDMVSLMGPIL